MKKFRVRVRARSECLIEVLADNEADAVKRAEDQASYGYRQWSSTPAILAGQGEVLMQGPADEPLIKIPETWEIYSTDGYEKIAKTANAKITASVRMACADMLAKSKDSKAVDTKYVNKLYTKYITPVFKKYEKLGTYDSEPRANVANVLSMYASACGAGDAEEIYEALRWGV
jgi:hypothetical protein